MIVYRKFKVSILIKVTIKFILLMALWSTLVVSAYVYLHWNWLALPWVSIGVIGTAVAFYIGFKNNSAYDRLWEARKIWGAIVNSSRTWGIFVKDYITNHSEKSNLSEKELNAIHQRLIYRHVAWLYQLKRQLRVIKQWEHSSKRNNKFRERLKKNNHQNTNMCAELLELVSEGDLKVLKNAKNPSTQLISLQSKDLKNLKKTGALDDFRHMEMGKMLPDFYSQQGKCERIKNFPLPRQYASSSYYFVLIFVTLLPLGLLSSFTNSLETIWLVIPLATLIGWVYWIMEIVGDYAEFPFENLAFDIPMNSLTRTIEIDLRQMLNEKDLPPPIEAKDGIQM